MGIKSSRTEDCRSTSFIRENVFTYYMECYYTRNGERYKYSFESKRILDLSNNTILDTTYTYTIGKKKS